MNRRSVLSNRTLATNWMRLEFKSPAPRPHLPHGPISPTAPFAPRPHRSGQYIGYVGVEFQRNLSTLIFHAACAQVGVATWWRHNFEKLTPPRRRPMSKLYWCKFSAQSEHLDFSRSKWVNGRGSVMTSFSRKINIAIVSGIVENIPVPNFSAIGALWIFDLPSGGPPAERSQHCAIGRGTCHVTLRNTFHT